MKNLIRFMSQASLSMIGPCLARVLICVLAISSSAIVQGQGMGGGMGGGGMGGGMAVSYTHLTLPTKA